MFIFEVVESLLAYKFLYCLQWDILSNGGLVQEMAHIANGRDPGNCVSLLRVNVRFSCVAHIYCLNLTENSSHQIEANIV